MIPAIRAVFLIHGREHLKTGLSVLDTFIDRVFPAAQYSRLVVDNLCPQEREERNGSALVVGGDNSSREFSGWDYGIGWLQKKEQLSDETVLVLANDTFHRNYGVDYLNRFESQKARQQVDEGGLVGYVDGYPQPIKLFGLEVQYWIRTSFILCRWGVLKQLLPLAIPCADSELFSADKEIFFRQPSSLSENYQNYLKLWLFQQPAEEDEFREAWHSKESLNEANLKRMQGKARSILCEHYLSARARSLGIPVSSVNLDFM